MPDVKVSDWLECPACGDEVFESDADGAFADGDEARCMCGMLCRISADGDSEDSHAWVNEVDESAVEMREAFGKALRQHAEDLASANSARAHVEEAATILVALCRDIVNGDAQVFISDALTDRFTEWGKANRERQKEADRNLTARHEREEG